MVGTVVIQKHSFDILEYITPLDLVVPISYIYIWRQKVVSNTAIEGKVTTCSINSRTY